MYRRLISTITILLICSSTSWGQIDNSQWARNFGPVGVSGTVKALKRWGDTLVVAGATNGLRATVAYSPGFLMFDLVERSWKLQSGDQMDIGDEVRALEVMPNGDLVVGGDFSFTSDGYTLENIAVYRKDGTWSTLSGDTSDFCQGPVNALLEYGDRLYIGGEFYQIGNVDTIFTGFFARWTENSGFLGTEDLIGAPGPGANPAVYALAHGPGPSGIGFDQRIYIGGSFYRFPDDTLGNIAYLETFSGYVYPLGGGTNGPVYALDRPLNSGSGSQLYIGGEFTVAGNSAVQNCATFNTNSNIWNPLGDGLNGPVYSIKQYPGSGSPIRFAGDFDSSSTMAVGAIPGWNYTTGSWETTALTTDAPIYAMEGIGGDFLAVGGDFEFAGDSSLFYGVFMAEDPLLSDPDQLWSLGDGLEIYDSPDEGANDVAVDDEGNFYIVGAFDYAGGRLVNNVAKWDGRKWQALGLGIDSNVTKIAIAGDTVYAARHYHVGTVYTYDIVRWDGMQWSTLPGEMPNGTINKMVVDTAGDLYIGGANLDGIGVPDANALVRWDGSQWSALGGPMSDPDTGPQVYDILVDSLTNELYVCGTFAFVDGVVARNVAKWDGSTWTGLGNPKTGNGRPYVIERSPEQNLIITGFLDPPTFVTQYGDSAWIQYAGGVSVPDVSDLLTIGCHVYITGDPLQYVGTEVDPFPVHNVGRWDGLQWDSLGSGTNHGISTMAAYGEQLAVGGDFDIAGGQYTRGFSIWNGVTRGDAATDLAIVTPVANDTLEYGDVFEILWYPGTTAELVAIEISLDSGQTWSTLHSRAEAARGSLFWTVPDTNAPFCKIRLSDGNAPCAAIESDFFFTITSDPDLDVRWLERPAGTYYHEPFIMGHHSWSWKNDTASAWPPEYWQALDYRSLPWPLRKIEDRSRFPDWWTFEDGWGEDYCWTRKRTPKIVRPSAYTIWNVLSKRGWDGSCYGFAVSCLLAWRHYDVTSQIILDPPRIHELPLTDLWRRAVNKYWSYQFGAKHLIYGLRNFNITPMETLRLFRDSSFAYYQYPRVLSMLSLQMPANINDIESVLDQKVRGHSIVPYRITNMPDSAGIYRIYVYDNNFPDSTSLFVRVDSINESWSYIPPADDTSLIFFDTCCGLYASLPIADFTVPPNSGPVVTKSSRTRLSGDTMATVLVSGREDILFTDSIGRQFGVVDGVFYNDDSLGFPMVPLDPHFSGYRPIGYVLPNGSHSVALTQLHDSVDFLWQKTNETFHYRRVGCDSSQTDNLIGNDSSWMVISNDPFVKNADVTFAHSVGTENYYFQLQGMPVGSNDSLNFTPLDDGRFLIENNGSGKLYDLILWRANENDEEFAQVKDIGIGSGFNQWIAPDWHDLEQSGILVFNDVDGDFISDNSERYQVDVITDVGEGGDHPKLPDTYTLFQNYPNPFNPNTTIEYSLPKKGRVMIEVFNIRGQTVRVLVDRDMPAGSHTVVWDGKNQAKQSVATGVYFYRMHIGERVLTKKMLLLK